MTEERLNNIESMANKVLENSTGYNSYGLAIIILDLIEEVRWLQEQVDMYEECHRDPRLD